MKNEFSMYFNKRDEALDMLKGIGIFCVVVGHGIQFILYPDNFADNFIFNFIYSFHMPLFMYVSGAASAIGNKKLNVSYLSDKFKKLMIPFMTWFCIYQFLGGGGTEFTL